MPDARAHVLVVEDDRDVTDLLRLNLEASDYRVTTAADGAEGLTAARDVTPDLILLDVMMPVLDGWQTLRALKEERELQDIPVVMLTALGSERDLIQGNLGGAVEYVTKPFDLATLMTAVARAVEEPDPGEVARRRARTVELLRRLAELDSGRSSNGRAVRWDRLEQVPERVTEPEPEPLDASVVDDLTPKQRYVAEQMARGRSARELSDELGVSRSNIYATRKRIGRKLGVDADDVPAAAKELGMDEGSSPPPPRAGG